ncbi:hypothetical protein D3C76_1329230 [compost metagenome]
MFKVQQTFLKGSFENDGKTIEPFQNLFNGHAVHLTQNGNHRLILVNFMLHVHTSHFTLEHHEPYGHVISGRANKDGNQQLPPVQILLVVYFELLNNAQTRFSLCIRV